MNILLTSSILVLLVSSSAFAQESVVIKFKPQLLTIDANEGIDLVDVDKDGKLDVIAGRNWFAAPDFRPRPLRTIDDWNGYVESNGDFAMDVDGDGWTDVVAGSFLPTEVNWFKNPGKEALQLGQLWSKHLLVDTKQSQNEAAFLHDFDKDGKPEWITNSWNKKAPIRAWRFTENEQGQPELQGQTLGNGGHGHGMGFGDVNNDGREDILVSLGWYERPVGDIWKEKWTYHANWNLPQASCPILVRDLNKDGKNDLIWGSGHSFGLHYWESIGADENGDLQFEKHTIDDRYSQPHTLALIDLDGDGHDELVTGKRVRAHNGKDPGGKEMPCMYYYKWDKSMKFERFVIDEGHVGTGLQIRSGDLDGDGDTDLAVAGKDGTWILFNQIK